MRDNTAIRFDSSLYYGRWNMLVSRDLLSPHGNIFKMLTARGVSLFLRRHICHYTIIFAMADY